MKKVLSPLFERPDLTPYLLHLTKRSQGKSAFENLLNILREGQINGSGNSGYVKGKNIATCFMDMPFQALKNLLIEKNIKGEDPRYEPYGIFYTKNSLYKEFGARPVLYLSDLELKTLGIPEDEYWRVVKFDLSSQHLTSWIHEREWRIKGNFSLAKAAGVLVKTAKEADQISQLIHNQPSVFKTKPYAIIPLELICQGLPYSDNNL